MPQARSRATVAVIGDNLTALALADELTHVGIDTLVLAGDPNAPDASPSLGFVRVGPTMHLARLAAGHGEARATDCVRAGLANRSLLERRADECAVPLLRTGSLRFASSPQEAAEMQRSVQLLGRLDREAHFDTVERFVPDAPPRFTHAARHDDDLYVGILALTDALRRRLETHGTRIRTNVRVRRIDDERDVRLETSDGNVHAEVVVVATEELLAQLVSFCRFKVVTMRTQALTATAPAGEPQSERDTRAETAAKAELPQAWSAAHGYENWVQQSGTPACVHVSGSRSLPVKEELGARRGTTPAVQALLESNLNDFDRWRRHAVARRWSTLQGVSCDGLPLVGVVPGRPRVLVCGGFGVNDVGWAFVAARTIGELLQHGRAEHESVFCLRRFL